jgi:hypothetical protein
LLPLNPDAESHYYLARLLVPLGGIDAALREFERIADMGFFCLPVFANDRGLSQYEVWIDFRKFFGRSKRATARLALTSTKHMVRGYSVS